MEGRKGVGSEWHCRLWKQQLTFFPDSGYVDFSERRLALHQARKISVDDEPRS